MGPLGPIYLAPTESAKCNKCNFINSSKNLRITNCSHIFCVPCISELADKALQSNSKRAFCTKCSLPLMLKVNPNATKEMVALKGLPIKIKGNVATSDTNSHFNSYAWVAHEKEMVKHMNANYPTYGKLSDLYMNWPSQNESEINHLLQEISCHFPELQKRERRLILGVLINLSLDGFNSDILQPLINLL